MRFVNRTIGSLILAGALFAPVVTSAAARPQDASVQVRVYDRDHKDYHNWDDREDHAYRQYLVEQHRSYREYNHQNRARQRAYWNWRHEHPDHD
jgi:type III secretory pathway component EscR